MTLRHKADHPAAVAAAAAAAAAWEGHNGGQGERRGRRILAEEDHHRSRVTFEFCGARQSGALSPNENRALFRQMDKQGTKERQGNSLEHRFTTPNTRLICPDH